MKDKVYLVLFAVVWTLIAIAMALHSIEFYKMYSLPFGRIDVDNYISGTYKWIKGDGYSYSHMLFMIPGAIAYRFGITPELLFSVVMPFTISLIPVIAFFFYFYMTKRAKVAFISLIFMIFGTFAMMSFWIMSLWGQAIATAFLMLAILFYGLAEKDKKCYTIFVIMVLMAFLAHYISPMMIILLALLKFIDEKKLVKAALMAGIIICGLFVMLYMMDNDRFGSSYPFSVGPEYIFSNAAFPLLWVLSLWGMFVSRKNSRLRVLSWFTVLGVLLSSQFVLWRPISTMLCFVAMFAGIGFVEIIERMSRFSAVFISVLMLVVLLNYAFVQYNGFMNVMLWEMVDNSPDTPRGMDPEPFRMMFFSGTEITTSGYITPFSNSTHETSTITKNGTVLPII